MRIPSIAIPYLLAALCAAGWPAPAARADAVEEDADHARARTLNETATSAYRAGSFTQALEQFLQAYALVPAPELLFNIGQCFRQLQRHEAAKAVFAAYLRAQPEAPERAQIERWIAASEHAQPLAPTAAVLPAAVPPVRTTPQRDQALWSRPARAPADDAEVYERWWFWTAIGVLAVGGGVSAALLLADDDGADAAPAGSLGTVRWN